MQFTCNKVRKKIMSKIWEKHVSFVIHKIAIWTTLTETRTDPVVIFWASPLYKPVSKYEKQSLVL